MSEYRKRRIRKEVNKYELFGRKAHLMVAFTLIYQEIKSLLSGQKK